MWAKISRRDGESPPYSGLGHVSITDGSDNVYKFMNNKGLITIDTAN